MYVRGIAAGSDFKQLIENRGYTAENYFQVSTAISIIRQGFIISNILPEHSGISLKCTTEVFGKKVQRHPWFRDCFITR